MSDFTSSFWGYYVAAATVVSILACGVLLYVQSKRRVKRDQAGGTTGHVWDGDLTEYNNPLPRWWMNLFWITIVFSLVYLVLYPGLGAFPGFLGWTQAGQHREETERVDARVAPLFAKYAAMDIRQVAADAEARGIGERLFLNHCAQCHGSDAGGAKGFPSLRDGDWLYGGEPAAILASIQGGRSGIMPAFGAALDGEEVKNVVAYVRSLSGMPVDTLRAELGRPKFATLCAACHGADGKGNPALGAPNLSDRIWLHGGSEPAITETIVKGRNAAATEGTRAMPSFERLIAPEKIHLLAAYVWGLADPKERR